MSRQNPVGSYRNVINGSVAACRKLNGSLRGSHTAGRSLEKAMLDYLDQRNKDPKPFVWTADADLILGKVARLSKRISDLVYDSGH